MWSNFLSSLFVLAALGGLAALTFLCVAVTRSVTWMACVAAALGGLLLALWVYIFSQPPHWEADLKILPVFVASSALLLVLILKLMTLRLAAKGVRSRFRFAILFIGFLAILPFATACAKVVKAMDIPLQPRFDLSTLR